jgi:hypothetical protein
MKKLHIYPEKMLKLLWMHLLSVSSLLSQPLGLQGDLVNVADHVEGNLGQVIVLAIKDLLESGDGLVNGDQLAGVAGENLSDLK